MNGSEDFLLHVLVQLLVILTAARIGGWVMRRIGQPQVVGEIVAGLVLGPSLLGRFAPDLVGYVFSTDTVVVFRAMSELGLLLLMFLIGLEFDFSHLRYVGRTASSVAAAGILLPFAMGAALAWAIHPIVAADMSRNGFVLIVAVALSITAIPILGRIMMDFNIHRTRIGTLTITAAAIDDALGWILLAGVSAAIHGSFEIMPIIRMLLMTILFVVLCGVLVRPLLTRLMNRWIGAGELPPAGLATVLITVLLAGIATNLIGIFSIFGPFVLGASLSNHHELRDAVTRRLRDFVNVFFLPIFFTYTGLRTDIGKLETTEHWIVCGLLLAVAIAGKMGGSALAARLGGFSWRECGCIAVMMNTRALMGLIAINVGRELGVVPDSVFCMLVIMAIFTTLMTSPLLRRMIGTGATLD